jgi:hypothetical protein
MYVPYSNDYVEKVFRHREADGRRYQTQPLHAKQPGGDTSYEWKGKYPPGGRYWAFSRENMERLDREGRIYYSKTGVPRYKIYLDDSPGRALQDIWDDISPVHTLPSERLGYPTQKPLALLERIISYSTNEGDWVLDPFCGCGTAVVAAQHLKRRWIGIDVTHLAINLVKRRLHDSFGKNAAFKVIGEPVDAAGAADLAKADPYQFQWWALGLVDARPAEGKRGADQGIDGRIFFHDEADTTKTKQVVLQVKAGHVSVRDVRDLRGVLDREKAGIGVLISLEEPTKPMRREAADTGFYRSPGYHKDYPRLQVLTIGELLAGGGIDMPPPRQTNVTFKRAPKAKTKKAANPDFLE